MSFPYQHADKIYKPHKIPQTFAVKKSIRGNSHEKATLLRLLPLIIGNAVPEEDGAWTVLMELKEIVELSLCSEFTGVHQVFTVKDTGSQRDAERGLSRFQTLS